MVQHFRVLCVAPLSVQIRRYLRARREARLSRAVLRTSRGMYDMVRSRDAASGQMERRNRLPSQERDFQTSHSVCGLGGEPEQRALLGPGDRQIHGTRSPTLNRRLADA
jgi:hypothetical protein